ncbi:MAG: HDOD domain-containing protein [Planctomycetota bacterium]|jgi:HD-like signal output (HDOD) protein
MNSSVLDAIKKSAAVPSMPQVVARFLEIMQDPNFEYADLVKVLSVDPGTVSEILRLANSALFGVRNKIISLRQALTLLGPKRVRSLVLGRYLVDSVAKQSVAGLDMSYFWRRSLASSVVASRFAERVLPKHRDEAFLGALLADIGIPILGEAFPSKYKDLIDEYCPHGKPFTSEQETGTIGGTHGEVAGIVLAHWGLPELICKAVVLHHSDDSGSGDFSGVARLLNASDRVGKLLCEVSEDGEIVSTCTEAMDFAGIELGLLIDMLPTIERDIEELASVLKIDVIPSNVYRLIAEKIQEALSNQV